MASNIEYIILLFQMKQDYKITDNDILDKFMEVADNNLLKQVYSELCSDIVNGIIGVKAE